MHKLVAALFLFAIPLPAFCAESTEHWTELRSAHFVVYTDSNEKQARRVAIQFEQMRSVFHLLIPNASADAGAPIVVLALKDRKGFQSLEPPAYLAKGQLDLAGLFLRAPDKNYILLRLDAQGEHPFATVYHEYTHLMMSKAVWVPLWLNEGLAEFYQNTDIHEKDVLLGEPSSDNILFLRQSSLLPLTTLLSVDHTSPYYHDEQKGSVFYAESWALTHYIEVTDREKNTNRLADYARLLAQHEDPVTAAQHAFGDLKQLQKSLEYYVHQGNFQMFRMNQAVTADESAFRVRSVPKPEIDAVRADVLIDNDRPREAQALLDATLRDDPRNALAREAMGFLKFREGDTASARKWYGEAVQLDSQSYLAHFYFAAMSMQTGDGQDDVIESSLLTSIKLNPSFAPAYDTLAQFYATRHEKLQEAHVLNLHAVQLEPADLNYRINSATVLVEQEQYPVAISVLKAAKAVAKTPEELAQINTRIEQIEHMQSARAQNASSQAGGETITTEVQVSTMQPSTVSTGSGKTVVFKKVDGKMLGTTEAAPSYPTGDATGPKHTLNGVIRGVQCSYPSVITLRVDQDGKTISLYNNNFYKIAFTLPTDAPDGEIKPCTDIEGHKASVRYAEIKHPDVAGQIVSIELSK